MKMWSDRAREVAYLLNPAFCGRILYGTIKIYAETTKRGLPFPLIYLALPLILHKPTRERINSRTQLLIWIQRNPELLIDFARRAHDLVPITNESLELLLQSNIVCLTPSGELDVVKTQKSLSKTKFVDEEVKECLKKSEQVAKWFAATGKVETIYIALGVRP